jgi:hypothetical protein
MGLKDSNDFALIIDKAREMNFNFDGTIDKVQLFLLFKAK